MGKTADRDITVTNDAGQRVVLVHKGQEVPDDIDDRKEAAKPVQRNADDDEIEAARGVQDKARRGSKGK